MNNLTPLLILFALQNKSGFESIKSAVDAAESFAGKLGNIQSIMKMLPAVMSAAEKSEQGHEYVDTLKEVLEKIS